MYTYINIYTHTQREIAVSLPQIGKSNPVTMIERPEQKTKWPQIQINVIETSPLCNSKIVHGWSPERERERFLGREDGFERFFNIKKKRRFPGRRKTEKKSNALRWQWEWAPSVGHLPLNKTPTDPEEREVAWKEQWFWSMTGNNKKSQKDNGGREKEVEAFTSQMILFYFILTTWLKFHFFIVE